MSEILWILWETCEMVTDHMKYYPNESESCRNPTDMEFVYASPLPRRYGNIADLPSPRPPQWIFWLVMPHEVRYKVR